MEATADSVGPKFSRPTFWTRVLASLVDYVVILGWMLVLAIATGVLWLITGELFNWLELGTVGAQLLGFFVLVLPVGIYLYLTEASAAQASLGKRRLRLQVVDALSGARASKLQIFWRTVFKLLPWEIAHFSTWNFVAIASTGATEFPLWLYVVAIFADLLPLIYLLFVAFQPDGRGPHDLVARTKVLKLTPVPRAPRLEPQ